MIAKILPRMSNKSLQVLDENENLITSSAIRLLQLTQGIADTLGIENIVAEDNKGDYDIIISRWMGDDIDTMDKSKPIYEFHYCGLNGGWFFERYTHNDISFVYPDNLTIKDRKTMKKLTGLSKYFYEPVVKVKPNRR